MVEKRAPSIQLISTLTTFSLNLLVNVTLPAIKPIIKSVLLCQEQFVEIDQRSGPQAAEDTSKCSN